MPRADYLRDGALLQHIADAGASQDMPGVPGVFLELLSQPGYIHPQQVGIVDVIPAPDLLQYLVGGHYAFGIVGQV